MYKRQPSGQPNQHGSALLEILVLNDNRAGNVVLRSRITDDLRHAQANLRQLRICFVVHRERLNLVALQGGCSASADADLDKCIVILAQPSLAQQAFGIDRPAAGEAGDADALPFQVCERAQTAALRKSHAEDIAALSGVIELDRAALLDRNHLAAGICDCGGRAAADHQLDRGGGARSWKRLDIEALLFPEAHLDWNRASEREQRGQLRDRVDQGHFLGGSPRCLVKQQEACDGECDDSKPVHG